MFIQLITHLIYFVNLHLTEIFCVYQDIIEIYHHKYIQLFR